jgi:hypothetical protein
MEGERCGALGWLPAGTARCWRASPAAPAAKLEELQRAWPACCCCCCCHARCTSASARGDDCRQQRWHLECVQQPRLVRPCNAHGHLQPAALPLVHLLVVLGCRQHGTSARHTPSPAASHSTHAMPRSFLHAHGCRCSCDRCPAAHLDKLMRPALTPSPEEHAPAGASCPPAAPWHLPAQPCPLPLLVRTQQQLSRCSRCAGPRHDACWARAPQHHTKAMCAARAVTRPAIRAGRDRWKWSAASC